MVVAGLLGDLAAHQVAGRLEVEHEDLRLQERGLHPLALARAGPLLQRDQDAERAEEAGGEVGQRNSDAHRPLAGQAGDRHEAAHALGDLVEARPRAVGAVLAEAGDAGVDDPGIDRPEIGIGDAEAVLHVGAEVLDDDVGPGDQALEERDAGGRLQIQGQRALVAVEVHEVGAVARAAHRLAFLQRLRHLDLDDVGAPVGELADRGRARPDPREVEHDEARERHRRGRSARMCHL
jgi:hypothetical protein